MTSIANNIFEKLKYNISIKLYYWGDKMLNAENIVDALIELRDKRNWTSYKVAVKSNLPASTIANVFNKKTMPQLDTFLAICRGFEITPAQFFAYNTKYDELTDDENEILKLWKRLTPEEQTALINLLYLLY